MLDQDQIRRRQKAKRILKIVLICLFVVIYFLAIGEDI